MTRSTSASLALLVACAFAAPAGAAEEPGPGAGLGTLPLAFVPNAGQLRGDARYHVQAPGPSLAFGTEGFLLRQQSPDCGGGLVRVRFVDAEEPRLEALEPLPGVANFYLGADRSRWREGLPTHEGIVYRGAWPGVDVEYSGSTGRLKSEVRLEAGVDPSIVRFRFEGVEELSIGAAGELRLHTALGTLVDEAPIAWQEVAGRRVPVECRHVLLDERTAGFELGPVDPASPLVIDPVLDYSTYYGGGGEDAVLDVGLEGPSADRSLLACGRTASVDFPVLFGEQDELAGGTDAFALQLDAAGDTVLWSTYVGGSGDEEFRSLSDRNFAGWTDSTDLPAFLSPVLPRGGRDVLLALSGGGSGLLEDLLVWGGSGDDEANHVQGYGGNGARLYGRTSSDALPLLRPFDSTLDGPSDGLLVAVARPTARAYFLESASYLGGSGDDEILGADRGQAFGRTDSPDFPGTAGAFQDSLAGGTDGFVARVDFDASLDRWVLDSATYAGGSADDAIHGGSRLFAAVPLVAVVGVTESDDLAAPGAIQPARAGGRDAFIWLLDPELTELEFGSYLGGPSDDAASAVAITPDRRFRVAGWTESPSFPTRDALQPPGGGRDGFLLELEPTPFGLSLLFGTHLGGSGDDEFQAMATDSFDCTYLGGRTSSTDLPLQRAVQSEPGGDGDGWLLRICEQALPEDGEFDLGDIADRLDDIENCACDGETGGGGDGGGDCDLAPVLTELAEIVVALEMQEARLDGIEAEVSAGPSRSELRSLILELSAAVAMIEAKLDDRPDLDTIFEALARLEADVAALEAKLDAQALQLDSIASGVDGLGEAVADLDVDVASLEAKADEVPGRFDGVDEALAALEAKADTVDARFDELDGAVAALEAKADMEADESRDELLREIEARLEATQCVPWLWLPAGEGGRLELARDHVAARIEAAVRTGDPDVNPALAAARLAEADAMIAAARYSRACSKLSDAIRALTGN